MDMLIILLCADSIC